MVLVSACLAGVSCRWDGAHKADPRLVDLVRSGKAIAVCPEQLGGLPTPRAPSEIRGDRVVARDGRDVTKEFQEGAGIVLSIARRHGCSRAVLKSKSPSCGSGYVYDGSFSGKLVAGDGLAARLLKANGIEVLSEEQYGEG